MSTAIEWTDATWNPVTGCTKVSAGCDHCYAETQANGPKLRDLYRAKLPVVDTAGNRLDPFAVRLWPERLKKPASMREPRMIFVNSMSDLFHDQVPLEYIQRVFGVMNEADWHQYQVLTKRAERLEAVSKDLRWAPHIWMGVSVENEDYLWRVDHLRRTGAHLKFLSIEPLLGPLGKLDLRGIEWVIVGGESGPGARPMNADWVADIRNLCVRAGVAFFFKQWGGVQKKRHGRELDGRTWDEMPELVTL
jgi:protein gp37